MRRMMMLITAIVSAGGVTSSAGNMCEPDRPTLSVQVHDYAHVTAERLSLASDIVSRLYAKIGVRLEWQRVLHPDTEHGTSEEHESPGSLADLFVIILTPKMMNGRRVPEGLVGFAAVPSDGGMGRIAYVIDQRVREIAGRRGNAAAVLGFVMAHEIGHLVLGRGSGAATGLMKCQWEQQHMQRLDVLKQEFSAGHADRIRKTLTHGSAACAAPQLDVAGAGSQGAGARESSTP